MKKTAIILGATGLTGGILLKKLIQDDRYHSVLLFSRSKIEGLPAKVSQHIGDVLHLEQFKPHFRADDVFCCIGTTARKTPDKSLYKQIDYGIPVAAATLAKANNCSTFIVISAIGAHANSSIFYNRTKGEMERDVRAQNIKNTYILRPSLIDGNRKERRILESIALVIFKLIQPLYFGKLKRYKTINASTIAQAMINLANNTQHTEAIIASYTIKKIAKNT